MMKNLLLILLLAFGTVHAAVTTTDANDPYSGGGISSAAEVVGVFTGTPDGTKFLRDDGTLQAITGGGDALVANPLSQFAATTSAQIKGVISDEVGFATGKLLFVASIADCPSSYVTYTASTGVLACGTFGTGIATALAINVGSAGAPVLLNGAGGTPSSMVGTNITGTAAGLTAGTASAVAVGGITGLGTGVATALAINVGSAGAPVTFNGALGTPSSGTGTNLTGIPIATGISGLGSGVATFLATPNVANFNSMSSDDILATGTLTNGKICTYNSTGPVIDCNTDTSGTGDVVGPASAVDNTLARYDGTTGKLLQGYTSNAPVCTDAGACTFVAPALGTPTALVGTNITGTAAGLTAGTASAVAVGGITGLGTGVGTALAVANNSAGGYSPIDGTAILTNKTLNAESTGNVLTTVEKVWLPSAGCNNATASSFWDLPTSNAGAAACITGTNTQKGVLDFDAATDESAQTTLALPADFTGTIDARIKWLAAATSGDTIWNLATICVADAETDDPAFNTASAVTDTAKGTTNQTNDAAITTVTITGCAAGELMHLKISRDADNGSDTMTGDARLIGVELSIRRAQ